MDHRQLGLARIAEHPSKGKALVATQTLSPGRTVLHEAPLMLLQQPFSPENVYRAFRAAPSAVQAQVLEFWSPVDGPTAAGVRAEVMADPDLAGDVETLVKVYMVFKLNSAHVDPEGSVDPAGRASHSCNPNCTYFSDAEGWITVRTVLRVEQGQELTIGYMLGRLQKFAFQTVCQRQAKLLADREFLCDCARCTAYGDDMRVFPCTSPACSGYHLVHQPSSKHSPEFTPCSACSSQLSAAAAAGYLATEAQLDDQLDKIKAAEHANDQQYLVRTIPVILGLDPPHPHHAAAARIAWRQYLVFSVAHQLALEGSHLQQWEGPAASLEAVIKCETAAVPCNQETPHEELGDTILKMPRPTAQHIRRAEHAYRRAMQLAMLARGLAGHDKVLSSKLAATQARLPAEDIAALGSPTACSFCGGGGLDGRKLSRCGRCYAVAYCCRKHQSAQWSLHKQHCQPPA